MVQQIITLQEEYFNDEWFRFFDLTKPTEYFVYRSEAYYIYKNWFVNEDIDSTYKSYWISQTNSQRKVSSEEWHKELYKYEGKTLSWQYQIRPVSGAVVCVLLQTNMPRRFTGPMNSQTGSSRWSIDTSKDVWQLTPYYDGSCEFRDTDLLRTALWYVQ